MMQAKAENISIVRVNRRLNAATNLFDQCRYINSHLSCSRFAGERIRTALLLTNISGWYRIWFHLCMGHLLVLPASPSSFLFLLYCRSITGCWLLLSFTTCLQIL